MLSPLQRLLGDILAFFYDLVPNFGVGIILLTVLVNIILFPLTLRQVRSTRALQEIQPEVKKLQKEYKDEPEALQKEVMALYKERGVNPVGCLVPMLIQLPIWWALFGTLRADAEGTFQYIPADSALATAISGGTANFFGMQPHISPGGAASQGLVTAIPYLATILLVIGSQYYQTRQANAAAATSGQTQPAQMQVVTRIMPLFFGFISWGLPAGLVLYFAASNLFRIGQQTLIYRLEPPRAVGGAEPQEEEPEAPPKPPQKHPSSKKKKRKRRRK